jgi:hypothetical protein
MQFPEREQNRWLHVMTQARKRPRPRQTFSMTKHEENLVQVYNPASLYTLPVLILVLGSDWFD